MTEPLSILNIGGHPKDAILYAGGTMAKHAARGDRVTILTPTTGLSHHLQAIDEYRDSGDMPDMEALVEERRNELVAAAAELGVTDVRFLGYDDQIALPSEEMVSDIADVIGETRPNRYPLALRHRPDSRGHNADDLAGHRRRVGDTSGQALRPHRRGHRRRDGPDLLPRAPGAHQRAETLNMRVPTTIIDITDTAVLKANAMNRFTSQHYGEDSPLHRKLGEGMDGGTYAVHSRVAYAEAFLAHNPEVYEYLPVSDYRRMLSARTPEKLFDDMTKMLLG